MLCPNRHRDDPDEARCCTDRGHRPEAADVPAGEERRVVTALFAGPAGFAGSTAAPGPEDPRHLAAGFRDPIDADLRCAGGTVSRLDPARRAPLTVGRATA